MIDKHNFGSVFVVICGGLPCQISLQLRNSVEFCTFLVCFTYSSSILLCLNDADDGTLTTYWLDGMAFVGRRSKITAVAALIFVAVFSCVVTCVLFVGSAKTGINTTKKFMLTVKRTVLRAEAPEVVKYVILDSSGAALSFRSVLEGLADPSSGTSDYLSTILTAHCEDTSRATGEAYFWEVSPVSRSTLDKEFEFVMIPARSLSGVSPDHSPFDEHLSQAKSSSTSSHVITFKNLGGDATLIVPRPLPDSTQYAHLADFLRSAVSNPCFESFC